MNMKNIKRALFLFGCMAFMNPLSSLGERATAVDTHWERVFTNVPDSIQTTVYWHWISGNISKEGVIKDLESMKHEGINRAFIGNIGLSEAEITQGKVKVMSEEWWEIMHAALKKATELGIEIGIFNCPGWSQAGGPWIKPEQSMRYLTATQTEVSGGKKVSVALKKPEGDFQDVKVIAFPNPAHKGNELTVATAKVSSSSLPESGNLMDGDMNTEVKLNVNKDVELNVEANTEFPLRNITVTPGNLPIKLKVEIQSEEHGTYKTISKFDVDRTRLNVDVGFMPSAPVSITVPKTVSKRFRILISKVELNSVLKEISLSSVPQVERYAEKSLAKLYQTPLPYWHEYQWKQQPEVDDRTLPIAANQVVDLTEYMKGDVLTWVAPKGEWLVMRYGMLPTMVENGPAPLEGRGLEVDKMTSAYLKHHFDSFLGKIIERIPAEDRKCWKVVVCDSYEKGAQNFTDTFLQDFKQAYGYDALPYLPAMMGIVVNSQEASDRFLWDMRRMVADKLSYEHIGGIRKLAHQNGFTIWLENYGHWGFPGEFLQYGGQSDEVAGEFWSEGTLGDLENRAASSCAHIYGKNKVSSESFTCGGKAFSRYPAVMKQRGDLFFSEGINNSLLHVYISQFENPQAPGLNAPYGNEFNRMNTWYPHLDLFTTYLKRCNYMLQQGVNVADVAYFIGEDTPKMIGITDPMLPKGYQFDYINAEVIIRNLSVKDGLLTLPHGVRYRMLVLPQLETMRPELLEKIKQLVIEGAVVLGPRPKRSPSLQNYENADRLVNEMAEEIWGDVDGIRKKYRQVGKGIIISGMDMEEAMQLIQCVPDFETLQDTPVLYGHRKDGNRHIYFLTNQTDQSITFSSTFRVKNMQPELWNPVTGSIRKMPQFEEQNGRISLPVKLQAFESAFIVFREKKQEQGCQNKKNYPDATLLGAISSSWKVKFTDTKRGPAEELVLDSLYDLSTSKDQRAKYYSGKMTYTSEFVVKRIPKEGRSFIDLGEVAVTAKVKVNGKYVGGVWTAPYKVDFTGFVRKGKNTLEVEVLNTWVNRLIGDAGLPKEQRTTSAPNNPWKADSPLQKTGLLGPVRIEHIEY